MTRHSRALVGALLLVATGCGTGGDGGDGEVLTVYAAASLTAGFEELAERFEQEHDVEVRLAVGGSSDLAAQIRQGAPADVFASADEPTMATLEEAGLVEEPRVFATNTLQIAVPPSNPAGVATLGDVARPGVQLVVCAPEVPCGAAASELAERAGVSLRPVSEEQSVTGVLDKVRTGEADAGLVYLTDVAAADGAVAGVDVPEADEVVNTYPIAPVTDSAEPELAQAFTDLVLGDHGQDVLGRLGFGAPR